MRDRDEGRDLELDVAEARRRVEYQRAAAKWGPLRAVLLVVAWLWVILWGFTAVSLLAREMVASGEIVINTRGLSSALAAVVISLPGVFYILRRRNRESN